MSPSSLDWLIVGLASYLIGGIPTAYLAARLLKGQDIRRVGDRNVGAANVFRNVGPRAGIAVGVIDIAKGAVAVLLARVLFDSNATEMIAGVAVISGHNWPVYFRLRGGRGAATAVGVLLAMLPALAIPLALSAVGILWLTKKAIKSLGFFLVSVPILAWWPGHYPYPTVAFAVGIPLLVGVSHYLSVKRQPASKPGGERAMPHG